MQLEAHDTQFLSIQSRTTVALEHQQRVSALLSKPGNSSTTIGMRRPYGQLKNFLSWKVRILKVTT